MIVLKHLKKQPFHLGTHVLRETSIENTKLVGCLVCVFKQPFSIFKQHFTYYNALFHPHVFLQIFSNNNFLFLNTCTKRALTFSKKY